MKINSVTLYNYNSNNINFKRTAVPYPEYMDGYNNRQNGIDTQLTDFIDKISGLFSPSVTKKSAEIKAGIDGIYGNNKDVADPKAQLLSVLA